MGLFRRRETLNEKLLREAGLDGGQTVEDAPPPPPPEPPKPGPNIRVPHGTGGGPRTWDAAFTVHTVSLEGDRIEFTTVPNGDLIIDEQAGDGDVSPLADAVERHRVSPPYRAVAQRQDGETWAVAARRIDVANIPFPDGEKLGLARNVDDEEFRVDDEPSDEAIPPELAEFGETVGDNFYVEAERIDGDLWEIKATVL